MGLEYRQKGNNMYSYEDYIFEYELRGKFVIWTIFNFVGSNSNYGNLLNYENSKGFVLIDICKFDREESIDTLMTKWELLVNSYRLLEKHNCNDISRKISRKMNFSECEEKLLNTSLLLRDLRLFEDGLLNWNSQICTAAIRRYLEEFLNFSPDEFENLFSLKPIFIKSLVLQVMDEDLVESINIEREENSQTIIDERESFNLRYKIQDEIDCGRKNILAISQPLGIFRYFHQYIRNIFYCLNGSSFFKCKTSPHRLVKIISFILKCWNIR